MCIRNEIENIIIFMLGDHEFGLCQKNLPEILKPDDYLRQSTSRKGLLMKTSEHAETYVNIHCLFGLEENDMVASSKVLSLTVNGKTISFMVDKVIEIMTIDPDRNGMQFRYKQTNFNLYSNHALIYQERVIMLLDIDRLIKDFV